MELRDEIRTAATPASSTPQAIRTTMSMS